MHHHRELTRVLFQAAIAFGVVLLMLFILSF